MRAAIFESCECWQVWRDAGSNHLANRYVDGRGISRVDGLVVVLRFPRIWRDGWGPKMHRGE